MPNTVLAELHTHSTASDGEHEPAALGALCAERGVALWALTDHDTMAGCAAAAEAASRHGIEFIGGVEISAREGRSIHVLGYGLDWHEAWIEAYFRSRRDQRIDRMREMVTRVRHMGVEVTFEEVAALAPDGNLTRPHLARALVERGVVRDVAHAFDRFIGDGKPGYVPNDSVRVEEAIALIHRARGVAILAHPGIYDRDDQIAVWIEAGLDGIEVVHPSHTNAQVDRYASLAMRVGILPSASSDFHGAAIKPDISLGVTRVPGAWVEGLREAIRARRASSPGS